LKNAGTSDKSNPRELEGETIVKRAIKAERIVRRACKLIRKRDRKRFPRCIDVHKNDAFDMKQIDVFLETRGSMGVEIQVKSTEGTLRRFYRRKRNRHILALNPYHYGEDITATKLKPILEELVLYAIAHPFESPYDWYYSKEYHKAEPPV